MAGDTRMIWWGDVAKRLAPALGLLASVCAAAPPKQGASEYAVKAAFLMNFARFVEWPSAAMSGSSSPVVVGVAGPGAIVDQVQQTIGSKSLEGRKIVVKSISTAKQAEGVHVLFIPSAGMSRLSELSSVRKEAVLVVGESEGFARKFGHIGFVPEGNKLGFEINATGAKTAGLNVSSKLLQLAKWVG